MMFSATAREETVSSVWHCYQDCYQDCLHSELLSQSLAVSWAVHVADVRCVLGSLGLILAG